MLASTRTLEKEIKAFFFYYTLSRTPNSSDRYLQELSMAAFIWRLGNYFFFVSSLKFPFFFPSIPGSNDALLILYDHSCEAC